MVDGLTQVRDEFADVLGDMDNAAGPPADCLARRALVFSAWCTALEFSLLTFMGVNLWLTALAAITAPFVFVGGLFGAIVGLFGIAWHGRKGLLAPGLLLLTINVMIAVGPGLAERIGLWHSSSCLRFF